MQLAMDNLERGVSESAGGSALKARADEATRAHDEREQYAQLVHAHMTIMGRNLWSSSRLWPYSP